MNNPSNGCGQPLPNQPHPGKHHAIHITVDDPNLGQMTRDFIIQIPERKIVLIKKIGHFHLCIALIDFHNKHAKALVFDLHGWTGSSHNQIHESPWKNVALNHDFILVWPNGMDDSPSKMGSWNCSRSDGPLGPPCNQTRSAWGDIECYDSCPACNSQNSCDWTTCTDDINYFR